MGSLKSVWPSKGRLSTETGPLLLTVGGFPGPLHWSGPALTTRLAPLAMHCLLLSCSCNHPRTINSRDQLRYNLHQFRRLGGYNMHTPTWCSSRSPGNSPIISCSAISSKSLFSCSGVFSETMIGTLEEKTGVSFPSIRNGFILLLGKVGDLLLQSRRLRRRMIAGKELVRQVGGHGDRSRRGRVSSHSLACPSRVNGKYPS
ncbi:unnamed protein product [Linum trigynum]|uniref:Uncharacterized protein n=1 Tax=Linum trigynum TaxID=586398 RepID=A0AAV2FUL1_9ROSI